VNPLATLRALALVPARLVYALWTALVFLGVGLTALLLLAVLPDVARRRAAARAAARTFLSLVAMPLTVRFPEHIPPANAWWCAITPVTSTASSSRRRSRRAFGFVISARWPPCRSLGRARRLGSEFVERFNRQRGAADARRVLRTPATGIRCVLPGRHLHAHPGLLKFTPRVRHRGARRLPGGAGSRARHPSGAGAERRPAAPRAARAADPGALAPAPAAPDKVAPELRDRRALRSLPHSASPTSHVAAILPAHLIQRARDLPSEPTLTHSISSANTCHRRCRVLQRGERRRTARRMACVEGAHRRDLILLLFLGRADQLRPLCSSDASAGTGRY